MPAAERDARYQLYAAELLLSVGRVDEARSGDRHGRARATRIGDSGWRPSAIIELAQDERDAALTLAQRAVELAPDASTPRIALSYAQQARFDIQAARDT